MTDSNHPTSLLERYRGTAAEVAEKNDVDQGELEEAADTVQRAVRGGSHGRC